MPSRIYKLDLISTFSNKCGIIRRIWTKKKQSEKDRWISTKVLPPTTVEKQGHDICCTCVYSTDNQHDIVVLI